MRIYLVLVVMAFFVVACGSELTCNAPYINIGDSCCLDKDESGVCDQDEGDQSECPKQAFDCDSCPPMVVTEREEVEITKFVCNDGETIVSDPEDCEEAKLGPEPEFEPIETNEDGQSVILDFSVRPACRGGFQGIEIFYDLGTGAKSIDFQFKDDPDDEFKTLYVHEDPPYSKYLYAVFCEGECTQNSDFFIEPGQKLLFRAKFDHRGTSYDQIFYSNEHVIDHTDDGNYAEKLC